MWEGSYHVAPAPHRRHGDIDDQVAFLLRPSALAAGLHPSGPYNVGDQDDSAMELEGDVVGPEEEP